MNDVIPTEPPARRAPLSEAIVAIEKVSKRFGRTLALDDVSFDIRDRELFAILGPNGAGKSTLIMILCTLLRPDSGTATVAGFDVLKQPRQIRRKIGVVFQDPSLDTRLTVEENLDFHGRVFEVPGALRKRRADELLDLVDLGDVRKRLVRTLSTGMKRRLEIARALMHDSRVVVLDEPTVGLDAQARSNMWDYLRRLQAERQVTLIVTTHYIEEVDTCDRVCIMDHGKVLVLDTPAALKEQYGGHAIRFEPSDPAAAAAIRGRFPDVVDAGHGQMALASHDPNVAAALLGEFGTLLKSINFEQSSLESVFLTLTGRENRDQGADGNGLAERGRGQEPRM
jgi:ABC-2 type transport system ATP-binding protein